MSRPSGSRSRPVTLLMATAVFLIVGVVVIALVPSIRCKGCAIRNAYEEQLWRSERYEFGARGGIKENPKAGATPPPPAFCEDCRPAGKMTLLRDWLRRANSTAR
jgi:hypothetical protein